MRNSRHQREYRFLYSHFLQPCQRYSIKSHSYIHINSEREERGREKNIWITAVYYFRDSIFLLFLSPLKVMTHREREKKKKASV